MADNTCCIFLVDDNPVNLKIGRTILQDKYTVLTIPSGEKLMLALGKTKPDLILLDVEMPGMNGYDVIKALKANPETTEIPVIFLTGKTDSENERIGRSLGAADYLIKPFSPPLLHEKIALHLPWEQRLP